MDFIRGCCKKMYIINNEYAILTQQWKICHKYKIFKLKINFAEYTLLIYIIKWNNYIKLQYTHVATFVEDSYVLWLPYDCMRSINRPYNTTIISWKTFCPYYTLILNNGTILKKSVTRRVL